jgi:hypothetical protein
MVTLQTKRNELDLIILGQKKTEWRNASNYNYNLLLKDRGDGLRDGNPEITEIKLISGYKKNAPAIIIEVKRIRAIKFTKDYISKEDNFSALAGMLAIEIILGEIKEKFNLN